MSSLQTKTKIQIGLVVLILMVYAILSFTWINSISAQEENPIQGTWSYAVAIDPTAISPGLPPGAQIALIATFQVNADQIALVESLSASRGKGSKYVKLFASVPASDRQTIGFPVTQHGALSDMISRRLNPVDHCQSDVSLGQIICTMRITNSEMPVITTSAAQTGDVQITIRTARTYQFVAIVNGTESTDSRLKNTFSAQATLAIRENTITVVPNEWGPEEEECWDDCDAPPPPPDPPDPPNPPPPSNDEDEDEDTDPYFSQGSSTTRSVSENSAIGTNVGSPVTAYAGNSGTLTYSIGGTNGSSFTVSSSTGQIRVNTSLDYESKNRYSVTLTVNETGSGSDTISVTINVTNVLYEDEDTDPYFSQGSSTTRSVRENSAIGSNVGSPVRA